MMGSVLGTVQQKWESSGGQRALANVTESLPEGTKDMLAQAKTKVFNLAYLRSPTVFLGIGEEKPFYVEKSVSLLGARLQHNFSFFYLNYFFIMALLFVLTLVVSPGAIVGIALLGAAWMAVIRATADGALTIRGCSISQKHASIAMSIVSIFVLLRLLSHVFWWTLFSSGFIIGMHALLRDASMHKDEEDKVEMSGDFGEDASFLNPADDSQDPAKDLDDV